MTPWTRFRPRPPDSSIAPRVTCSAGGEVQAAVALYERAYDVRRDKFGDDHPDTLTSASNLARNLWWLGEYQRARALDEDTLTRRRRILGEDHPDTLTSASQLAMRPVRVGELPAGPGTAGRDAEPAAPNPRRRPPRHPLLGQPSRPGPVVAG